MFAGLLLFEAGVARALLFSDASIWRTLGLEAAFILALLSTVEAFGSRWRIVTYALSAVVVSVALLGIVVYASWADRLLSPSAVQFAGEAWGARESVGSLFQPNYLLFLLGILGPAALVYFSRTRIGTADGRRHPVLIGLGAVALVACVFLTEVAGGAAAVGDSMAIGQSHGLFAYEFSALQGAPDKSSLAQSDGFAKVDASDPVSVDTRVGQLLGREGSARIADFKPGAYAGANVIVIQVESMQQFVLGLETESKEVTPYLNDLAEQSWYFPNAFSQIGPGTTSDAEFVMNTSLYAPRDEPACVEYVGKDVPSLPKLLRDKTYYSFTMHANTAHFWNRTQLYSTLGFGDYYERGFFGREDTVGMGMSDGLMFKKALPVVLAEANKGKFYCQIVTLSPHRPFRLPAQKQKLDVPGWLRGSILGDYLQCMNYEDRCLAWFIKRLKAEGVWDKSIVVIYGDHYGLRPADLELGGNAARFQRLTGDQYSSLDRMNVPLIIHLPGQTKGQVVKHPVGQADIMPTIADALGLDLTAVPHFGQSAFQQARSLVPLNAPAPEGSLAVDNAFYLGNPATHIPQVISLSTRTVTADTAGYQRSRRDAEELISLSESYIEALSTTGENKVPATAVVPHWRR